jgi:1,4-alpha-glucan branching enzyme
MAQPGKQITLLTEQDLYLFNEGSHFRLHEKLGSHLISEGGSPGTYFAVWAPDAEKVFVIGEFNGWSKESHSLQPRGRSGIWEGFIAGVDKGARYKYHIVSRHRGYRVDKADPFAFYNVPPPETVSIVWDLNYTWGDQQWMADRGSRISPDSPISIYELHLGSWLRAIEKDNRVCKEVGLHPCAVSSCDGAPFLRLLGLPGQRVLRSHEPIRFAAGFHVSHRLSTPA